jgi:mevalonate kinase
MKVGRACGKVILLGEHAVVYGVPAIAVGIDRGARARATPAEAGPSRLHIRGWNIDVDDRDSTSDLARAFRALLDTIRTATLDLAPVAVEVDADLSPAAGLGCSAAVGVAIARAIDPLARDDVLQARAMAWEGVFHGNPSGVDAAVAARGGCLLFRRGGSLEPIHAAATLHLCIGSTGCGSSTRSMVDALAQLRARNTELVDGTFQAVRVLVQAARAALVAGDRVELGRLMDSNQTLLGQLLLSTPDIERLCAVSRTAGAFGAKLTGAGGGGSVVALVSSPSVADAVLSAWKRDGFDGFATSVEPQPRAAALENETTP